MEGGSVPSFQAMADRLIGPARDQGPDDPPMNSASEQAPSITPSSFAGFDNTTLADLALLGVIPGLDALVASLRTCEVAAEATRAVGERFLTDACAQGLLQIPPRAVPAGLPATVAPGGSAVNPGQTTVSHIGMRAAHLVRVDKQTVGETPSLRTSLALLTESSNERPKRQAREILNETKQEGGSSSNDFNVLLSSLSGHSRDRLLEVAHVASVSTSCKRSRGNDAATAKIVTRALSSDSLPGDTTFTLRRRASAAAIADSMMMPTAGLPPENALGGLRALNRRQGAMKQSRMSRRLECFRREAEEALRGQHNATVMSIFSAIDSHIRSFRGGSMSPSELDLRIMTVIDKCLPLQGDEAKAVEAVLDMVSVRRLKATLEGRPRSNGAFLDLIALSKLCRHIPGVCFDKWNLGWIATWREHRRPVHKHFSAKKYGFFRAREFAICYRSKMTSDVTLEGADPPTSPRSIIAQGDFSPLLARSTEMLNEMMARQQLEHVGTLLPGENSGTSAASRTGTLALRRSNRATLNNGVGTIRGGRFQTGFRAPEGKALTLQRRGSTASAAAATHRGNLLAIRSVQQLRANYAAQRIEAQRSTDAFIPRDGWAALVACTPRVERVSFDFTNQSWIAQWKQHGRTTYRRFAVSKYGFATAHKLAVEYKSKYFKESPCPFASGVGTAGSDREAAPPASERSTADTVEAAQNTQNEQQSAALARGSRSTSTRSASRRQVELVIGDSAGLKDKSKSTQLPQTEAPGNPDTEQRLQSGEMQMDRSGVEHGATSSDARRHRPHQEAVPQQELVESNAKSSSASAQRRNVLASPEAVNSISLVGATSSIAATSEAAGGSEALAALLSSSNEGREMAGCSAATEPPAGGRGIEGTSTTAIPTSHTHVSGDSFPINASGPPLQQHPVTTETGNPTSDAGESQPQEAQQELQRTLLLLMEQSGLPIQDESPQQQTQQLEQPSRLAVTSATVASAMTPQVNQRESGVQGVEMLRTAIKCILLDLMATCSSAFDSLGGRRQVYVDLLDYHLRFVSETQGVEDLKPYSQLFAPSLHGKVLPSALPVAMRVDFLHKLEILFMQHQQRIIQQEQLTSFLVMQAQQQRQLQHQQQQQQRAAAQQH